MPGAPPAIRVRSALTEKGAPLVAIFYRDQALAHLSCAGARALARAIAKAANDACDDAAAVKKCMRNGQTCWEAIRTLPAKRKARA